MAKMKAVQVPKAGADFEIVEREIAGPGAGQVRIRVEACGVCHSDVLPRRAAGPASPIRAAGPRDSRRRRRGRAGVTQGRRAGRRRRLARRARRHVTAVPAGRLGDLPA